ncbi:hypothetical protein QDX92_004571 [Salmonella enterica]|nr:hypothetical protein [Salmonella enterica]EJF5922049.1 hypothetical protein [Salmonella enterica]EJF5944758.1 hypothetical protein [Salmonella enterica]EJH7819523.1 hypothetical protein [Salmonella enterica]EJW2053297.1 hypothetical protein [Salmonella enterica]
MYKIEEKIRSAVINAISGKISEQEIDVFVGLIAEYYGSSDVVNYHELADMLSTVDLNRISPAETGRMLKNLNFSAAGVAFVLHALYRNTLDARACGSLLLNPMMYPDTGQKELIMVLSEAGYSYTDVSQATDILFGDKKNPSMAGVYLWALTLENFPAYWLPEDSRWVVSDDQQVSYICADPSVHGAFYYVDQEGSVHRRNVRDKDSHSFPGISAAMVTVGGDDRLWALTQNGIWARYAPEYSRWDISCEEKLFICADLSTGEGYYYVSPDGSVHWQNVDRNIRKSFPGIVATMVTVGGDNRLWALTQNGIWARYAPEYSRWDIFNEKRAFICANPKTGSSCYYINVDGTVFLGDVDKPTEKEFSGITAKMISVSKI